MQRIPIPEAEPDAVKVRQAAEALLAGHLVVLPTETVHGLAVDPQNPAAIERLRKLKGKDSQTPFTHHIADPADFESLATPPPPRIRAYLDRIWPGPLTIILPAKNGGTVGVRVPAHDFTRATIRGVGRGLFMTSVNQHGEPPLLEPDEIAALRGIDMFFDAGPSRLGIASTVIRYTGDELEVLREGLLSEQDVLNGCARSFLFVCSGNTCRSPMAEALARTLASERAKIQPDKLLARGLAFSSAGTGAFPGMQASDGAFAAMQERGIDLAEHRSHSLDLSTILAAQKIFCMGQSHRMAVLAMVPGAAEKTVLLRPDGKDVIDPFGAPVKVYRGTAKEIEKALRQRLDEIV